MQYLRSCTFKLICQFLLSLNNQFILLMLFHFYSLHCIRNSLRLNINKAKVLNMRTYILYSGSSRLVSRELYSVTHGRRLFDCTTWHNWVILVKSVCKISITCGETTLLELSICVSKLLLLRSGDNYSLSLTWFSVKSFTLTSWFICCYNISLGTHILPYATKIKLNWLLVLASTGSRTSSGKHTFESWE